VSCYRLIDAEKPHHSVSRLTRVLGVARAGYYAWASRPPSAQASRRGTGSAGPRDPCAQPWGLWRPTRPCRAAAGAGRPRRAETGRPAHARAWAAGRAPPSTNRADPTRSLGHAGTRPGRAQLHPGRAGSAVGGRRHPAAHRRRLVVPGGRAGRVLAPHRGLVHGRPPAHRAGTGRLGHGHQPTPSCPRAGAPQRPRLPARLAFGRRLWEAGLVASMGTVGDALDNAVAESFFATLECELLDRHHWPTRQRLRTALFDFIEIFYNRQRRHSTLGYHPPADYEQHHPSPAPAA
jgi:putative transposase